ncbi:NAD(P)/FAD-dependent oxidoreductase [Halomonas cerina]|uniref:Amine oxidase domain-containing protein n=1 Tax=Halomonas cerina TaxID=447424 RepID=A0A839V8E2_9GAMM|nr:FAD-dependent oxidoreductase [Halomonas cerina]MBB3191692.1 hypothetical protein [Halomonas cerina]
MSHAPGSTAIIGAGIAGLACARHLQAAGGSVTLFDKARGPGGRMASRRLGEAVVDLGAQFFSVRDAAFRSEIERWQRAGVVARWPTSSWQAGPEGWSRHDDGRPRWCGAPRMSAVTRHLAHGLELRCATRIASLDHREDRWWLVDAAGQRQGPFAWVVIATPAPQARALLAAHEPALADACDQVIQRPCWTGWVLFDRPLPSLPDVEDGWQALRLAEGPLRFVARNQTKPGRDDQGESLSLLARLEWSRVHLEEAAEAVACQLLDAFRDSLPTGTRLPEPVARGAHRWRYAQPDVFAAGEPVNRDYRRASTGLALCGDAWRGPRIEDAWLSGHHLGEALVHQPTLT